jgi:hypothetical protein
VCLASRSSNHKSSRDISGSRTHPRILVALQQILAADLPVYCQMDMVLYCGRLIVERPWLTYFLALGSTGSYS